MSRNANGAMTPAVPSEMEAMLAQETSRRLEGILEDEPEYRFQLLQDDAPGQVFAIPASAMQLFVRMLAEMGQGNAVTVTRHSTSIFAVMTPRRSCLRKQN